MLKFVDKEGKVKFIQLDDDAMPREVREISDEVLRDLGFTEEEIDDVKKLKPQGISQDDAKFVKGS